MRTDSSIPDFVTAAIERGRAILDERQRLEDERQRQFEREAEERRQKHLAKIPEWARPFAVAGGNHEDYIKVDLPGCTTIHFKSTSYHHGYDSAYVSIPDSVEFLDDLWIVVHKAHCLDKTGIPISDVFDEAVAIAADHYDALCQMQADAAARNALPREDSLF